MNSPNQAHGGRSRPASVSMSTGVKTNVTMTNCNCTPKQSAKLKPTLYQTKAALSGNGAN